MTGLWLAVMAMIAGTVGLLLMPLMRRPAAAPARAAFDAAVYRDQLDEVERDVERGLLTFEQADAARTEIQRRLLAAADEAEKTAPAGTAPGRWRMIAAAVAVPVGGLALYLHLGSPEAPDRPLAARPKPAVQATHAGGAGQADMGGMVERLAERLKEDPEDAEGWLMLGRSYRVMERFDGAAEAYGRAVQLGRRGAPILIAYGEVMALAAGGKVAGKPRAVFEEALEKAPNDPRPRFYIAVAQTQEGDLKGALQSWVDLAALSPPDAPWLADVRGRIKKLSEELKVDPATVKPTVSRPE